MKYLLDVNVLLAWGWADHTDHRRVASWIGLMMRHRNTTLMTSAIPELGFVRVSVQGASGRISLADATVTLTSMLHSLKAKHRFVGDDLSSTLPLPAWCEGASRSTDAHLFGLAEAHGALLATLDTGIPGSFLIRVAVA